MFFRVASFLAALIVPGAIGWVLAAAEGALAGVAAGSTVWFLLDLMRGVRVLHWLRSGSVSQAPRLRGLWGEAADRMRRALKQREQRADDIDQRLQHFLSAIQASPNGVVLLDDEGRIEWSNQTAVQHLGIDPELDREQLIGNLLRDPAFSAYYASRDFLHEITIVGRESTPARPMKLSIHLHPYGQGRKLLLSRDITGVEQAEVMRRDFVANVSHEIRTPLTVLTGFVETLQSLPLGDEERARYLLLMAQQAHRMQTLVSDLLTLSRLEGSPPPGVAEWTPLALFTAQCDEEARALSDVLGRTQEIHVAAPPPLEIAGSPSELQSAMSNLVSNAIRYTPARGRIDVLWQKLPDGRAEFSVKDTGPGIASEHLPRLTERFYRVDRSRSRETGGTGLGLAIVKHVVQRHGAELKIDSASGVGSTFAIVLPASRVRPALSANSAARTATESQPQ
jgi:two-component system, OmpR family, phosphate regulon sensor histidine kinase PhoR